MSMIRTRWAAIGAAVAITLGAGGVSLTQAAISSGEKPVFVAIQPCRLIDTRPATQVGPRTSPLGPNETITLQVTGATGQCSDIPADATGAAMNMTAIQPTAQSFLTVYPSDGTQPNASNLNWAAGDPPTPNKVDVKLGADGAVKVFNSVGTVHLAADLVGYYIDHNHDDRYYTEGEVDGQLATKANAADVYTVGEVDTALGAKANADDVYTKAQTDEGFLHSTQALTLTTYGGRGGSGTDSFGCSTVANGTSMKLDLPLPAGAVPTAASFVYNDSGAGTLTARLRRVQINPGVSAGDGTIDDEAPGNAFFTRVAFDGIPSGLLPTSDLVRYYFEAAVGGSASLSVCGVAVTYTVDAAASGVLASDLPAASELAACDGTKDECVFAD